MNERSFNAVRQCEQIAAEIASAHGLSKPRFMLPAGGDIDIEFWRTIEAISAFLNGIPGMQTAKTEIQPATLRELIGAATIKELVDIPGIGRATAKRIKAAFLLDTEGI